MTNFTDDDLVYVDPKLRQVLGKVDWMKSGNPKPLPVEEPATAPENGKRRRAKKQYYPWGTYRSMKHAFRVEGKEKEIEAYQPLEEAISKALTEPFWD
ncbi:hypothetical protein COU80_03975 [Candidatus Peregrinibacteria bacterium CG10_big_fil_rev_8_21_14_0_10_55_24]|nr:MAG: hypothetical protein COU80_03975 [Candidatus Peregrinibacteria bacterium CG10_big_fil_rev_8_21_14_0_10_55_24]